MEMCARRTAVAGPMSKTVDAKGEGKSDRAFSSLISLFGKGRGISGGFRRDHVNLLNFGINKCRDS